MIGVKPKRSQPMGQIWLEWRPVIMCHGQREKEAIGDQGDGNRGIGSRGPYRAKKRRKNQKTEERKR